MTTLAVIGLGYVGLPLVVAFGRQMRTIGFDTSSGKFESCKSGADPSLELADEEIAAATQATYTADAAALAEAAKVIEDTQRDLNIAPMNEQAIKKMIAAGSAAKGAKVNVLGLTFKENCGDLRNSKVIDVTHELESYGVQVCVSDPRAQVDEAMNEYGVRLLHRDALPRADPIVAAVAHDGFSTLSVEEIGRKLVTGEAFIDLKAALDAPALGDAGFGIRRL